MPNGGIADIRWLAWIAGVRARSRRDEVGSLVDLLTSKEPGAAANLEGEERRKWIQQAVDELPEALREAVLLVYYQGLKYREAAERAGHTSGHCEKPHARGDFKTERSMV